MSFDKENSFLFFQDVDAERQSDMNLESDLVKKFVALDENIVVLAKNSGKCSLFDLRTHSEQIQWMAHTDSLSCVDSNSDKIVATGCVDGDVRMWDTRMMKCVASEFAHCRKNGQAVLDLKFAKNQNNLFTSGVDGSFNVYKFWIIYSSN